MSLRMMYWRRLSLFRSDMPVTRLITSITTSDANTHSSSTTAQLRIKGMGRLIS